jgi:Ca2+-binding RTX toxin-like protein
VLDGGPGNDTMEDAEGDDLYIITEPGDVTIDGGGNDEAWVYCDFTVANVPTEVGADIEKYSLRGTATSLTGNASPNWLLANATLGSTLNGRGGDDRLDGAAGNDALLGGEGNDVLDGAGGTDTMAGGPGDDSYTVDSAGDAVTEESGGGNDTVRASVSYVLSEHVERLELGGNGDLSGRGNALANTLLGNAGKNGLDGGPGADTMVGGLGDDTYDVDDANDQVVETAAQGNDTIRTVVSYQLPVDVERLVLLGTAEIVGTGNDADNELVGRDVRDRLDGRAGNDTLDGGGGSDSAIFASALRQHTLSGDPKTSATITGPQGTDALLSIESLVFVDGRKAFDTGDHLAVAWRLYAATLDRAPDPLGLNYHSARLDAGVTLTDVANGFVGSPEFQAVYGPLGDAQFVDLLYRNVLDRTGSPDEIAYHVGRMQAGVWRPEIVAGFSEAPEHIQKHAGTVGAGLWDIDESVASVARLYFGMLERTPETAGLIYYKEALAQGLTVQQAANGFAASPEFQAKYGALDDTAYVTQLYANILERSAGPDEVTFHVNRLAAGATRGDVAAGFTEAPEYQVKTLALVDNGIAVADAGFVLT